MNYPFLISFDKKRGMRKSLYILFVILVSAGALGAQSERNYIGLSIGPSFPGGDFAKTDLNDSTSGWAKTGVALQANYCYRITHNFGVSVMVSYSSNKFDNIEYKDALGERHQDTSFSVENQKNWTTGGIMIGPYLRFPLSSKLSWDIRGYVGFAGSTSPKLTIRATDVQTNEPLEPYYRESANALNFSYMLGTGFKYALNKYYILLFADYFATVMEYDNVTGWDWDAQPYKTSFKQDISYVTVTAGVGYFF